MSPKKSEVGVRRRDFVKTAGMVGATGTGFVTAGCMDAARGEFVAQPVIVNQPRFHESEAFQLLVAAENRVCVAWRGIRASAEIDLPGISRRITAVSWAMDDTTSTIRQADPPLTLGEFITVSTPKISLPGVEEQNPAAEMTPREVFTHITSGAQATRSPGSLDGNMVSFDRMPSGEELVQSAYVGPITRVELVEELRSEQNAFEAMVDLELEQVDVMADVDGPVRATGRRVELSDSYAFVIGWAPEEEQDLVQAVRSILPQNGDDPGTGGPNGLNLTLDGIDGEVVVSDCESEANCGQLLARRAENIRGGNP